MGARSLLVMLVGLAVAASSAAQTSAMPQLIDLADGGRVVIRADGSMEHFSAAGSRVAMVDGDMMIARDRTRLLMKGPVLWRRVVEQAANNYARAPRMGR